MFTVTGEYIVNHRIIENFVPTNIGQQASQDIMTYKIDDFIGIGRMDQNTSGIGKYTITDVSGRRQIENDMIIHDLLPNIPNKEIKNKLRITINFDIKTQNKSDINFIIITNRHFNLNNEDYNVYMINNNKSKLPNLNNKSKLPNLPDLPNLFQYNIKIIKNNNNNSNIKFNIRFNPNNDNDPYFVIRGLKPDIKNTLG